MRQVSLAAGAVLLALAAAAVAVFLWLRTYAPLAATTPFTPGPGLTVEPAAGGTPVLMAAGQQLDVTFTVHNTGRFAVTVVAAAPPGELHPARDVRIEPHDAALVTVRWRLDCSQRLSRARLRYRYLSLFRRTAAVELPFALLRRCSGASP